MLCLLEHAQQDQDNLIELQDVSKKLGVEGHFKVLWKRLEFPSTLELFPPAHPALNMCSCGLGLVTLVGIQSSGLDHMLENLDISYFDKVKSSTPASRCKAEFSKPPEG